MTSGDSVPTALRAVWARLSKRLGDQSQGYDGFVQQLSERLYRETLVSGGWAVDSGLLGPAHYRADAERMVREIALGSAATDAPSP